MQVICIGGPLESFVAFPDLNLRATTLRYMTLHKILAQLVDLIRLVGVSKTIWFSLIMEVVKDWEMLLDTLFDCKMINCLSTELIMVGLFDEFRKHSKNLVSEIKYGFLELGFLYGKKALKIYTKIVHIKGEQAFKNDSECIRMRVGQYFMPTYIGEDTSECVEYDDIILSVLEPTGKPWKILPLLFQALLFLSLTGMIKLCKSLVMTEWERYKKLKEVLNSRNQVRAVHRHYWQDEGEINVNLVEIE
ncbi:unnamed protein product [Moneuplotes crassus]|uniref:Uncharacterized protein n=1 Tax=Euplotes crassus TaxID=5936 RepID=A0AAD2D3A9_EUPCR|nr:unnamed protein product [Moneuplotes crassus]